MTFLFSVCPLLWDKKIIRNLRSYASTGGKCADNFRGINANLTDEVVQ
jgi:hypothetical protein